MSDYLNRQRGQNRNVSSVGVKLLPQMRRECQALQIYIIHGTVSELVLLIVTSIELNRAHCCNCMSYIDLLNCSSPPPRKSLTNSGSPSLRDTPRSSWLKGHHSFWHCNHQYSIPYETLSYFMTGDIIIFLPVHLSLLAFGDCRKCRCRYKLLFKIKATIFFILHNYFFIFSSLQQHITFLCVFYFHLDFLVLSRQCFFPLAAKHFVYIQRQESRKK